MPLITHSTDNMIGGVSQQPPTRRFSNQCEEQENALGTVIEGLRKRPPTEHSGVLTQVTTAATTYHTIDRDPTERYVVHVEDNYLRVFDLSTGEAKNVYDINGDLAVAADFNYLQTSDPVRDIEFLTIADATIILNKDYTPRMQSALTPDRGYEALAFVKQGNYSTEYILEVNTRTVTYTSGHSGNVAHEPGVQTSYIAEKLADALSSGSTSVSHGATIATTGAALTTGASGDWDIKPEGSVIWIKRKNGLDFSVKTEDSVASSVLAVVKDTVQTFAELPTVAPNGFVIKIEGVPDQGAAGSTSYYAKFETNEDTTDAFDKGRWEESVAGGILYQFDYSTMPHLLVRLSSGDFLFTQISGATLGGSVGIGVSYTAPKWGEITAGDLDSNPLPLFMNDPTATTAEKIRGMGYFKDRLMILAGETVVLSEVGQYFNFFRTTVTSLLDSARVSVVAGSTDVNLLNHAVPHRGNLVLFSDANQFLMAGDRDGTLTPTNVSIALGSTFESLSGVAPVASDQSIFFAGARGANTQIRELYDSSENRAALDAVDITGQAPSYVKGRAKMLAVSPTESCLVIKAEDPATLYIYKWSINGGERTQSAWSKFTFGSNGVEILNIDWVDEYLYLVVRRGTETSLERLNFEPFFVDAAS